MFQSVGCLLKTGTLKGSPPYGCSIYLDPISRKWPWKINTTDSVVKDLNIEIITTSEEQPTRTTSGSHWRIEEKVKKE